MQSTEIKDLITALSKAQGEFTPAIKDSVNPHFKSKFADLASIWTVCRLVLAKHGLAITQTYERDGDKMNLITTLAHNSGQWIKSCAPIILAKLDSQGIGSATSYMRRYSLSAMLGIVADEDDDGEASMPKKNDVVQNGLEKVTAELIITLKNQLAKCSEEYNKKIFDRLSELGHKGLEDIPKAMFSVIMQEAIKNQVK